MKRALLCAFIALAACGTTPQSQTVLCTEFQVGADLSHASFGVTGALAPSYGSLAQAAGDLATVGATMLRDVSATCEALARDLGADAQSPHGDAAWCTAAATSLEALRPRLEAGGFHLAIAPSTCIVDADYQTRCEARCRTDAACTETSVAERCAPADRVGTCAGVCTGKCDGPETVVDMVSRRIVYCDGLCRGGCTTELTDVVCAGPLAPPHCAGDADCDATCAASASARATCTDGAATARVDEGADPDLVAAAAAIARSAGPLLALAGGRARELDTQTTSVVSAAGHVLLHPDALGPEAAACGVLIGKTGETAESNIHTAADAVDRIHAALRGM